MSQSLFRFHLLAAAVVSVWGATFVLTRLLIDGGFSPPSLFIYRFTIAYLVISIFAPRRLFADGWRDELLFAIMGLTGGSLYFISENSALGITQVSNVAIIIAAAPLLTIFVSRIVRPSERFGTRLTVGALIALCGVVLAVLNGSLILRLNPLGDILTLVAASSWAVYSVILRGISERYSSFFVTRKVFFYGLLTTLLFTPFVDFHLTLEPFGNLQNIVILLFLSLVGSLLCFYLWTIVVKRIGVGFASTYLYFMPMVSLIVAVIVLDEVVTGMALAGIGLIVVGVYIAEHSKIKK